MDYYPPAGKMLIIDGGLSDEENQPVIIYSKATDNPVGNTGKSILVKDPLMGAGDSILSEREILRPANLKNRVGECDECALFYLKYFLRDQLAYRENNKIPTEKDPVYIDVITRDTDFIPNNLSFFHELAGHNFDVRVSFAIVGKKKEVLGPTKDILLVGKLFDQLKEKLNQEMTRPDLGLTAAMMITGNDYVDGYFGIARARSLEVFIGESQYIGNLVEITGDDWNLNLAAYLRFLRALYYNKYQKQIETFIKATMKKVTTLETKKKGKKPAMNEKETELANFLSKKEDLPAPADWWKVLPWSIIRHVIEIRNPANIKAHIPSPKIIWLRYLRLFLNLIILEKGYSAGPEVIDDICLQYGFSLIETSRPLSFHNVRLTEETDPTVKPSRQFMKGLDIELPPSPIPPGLLEPTPLSEEPQEIYVTDNNVQ